MDGSPFEQDDGYDVMLAYRLLRFRGAAARIVRARNMRA